MVQYCVVPHCKSNAFTPGVSFHIFPKDPVMSKLWQMRIRRCKSRNRGISSFMRVCSKHFKPSDYTVGRQRRSLSKGAVPSIFPYNSLKEKTKLKMQAPGSPVEILQDQEKCSLKPEDGDDNTEDVFALQSVPIDECLLETESSAGNSCEEHKDSPVIETIKSLPAVNGENISVKENSTKYLESEKEIGSSCSNLTSHHQKKTKSLDLSPDENISNLRGNLAFKNLLENLLVIKKPNHWWTITPVSDLVICARWNYENFMPAKRVVINSNFAIRVFLKEWEINISELIDITCVDDISVLLEKVENYKIP